MSRITWTSKAEIDEQSAQVEVLSINKRTIEERAVLALETNRAFVNLTAPTNSQTLAEVKALARQNNAIIRLLLNKLDATD